VGGKNLSPETPADPQKPQLSEGAPILCIAVDKRPARIGTDPEIQSFLAVALSDRFGRTTNSLDVSSPRDSNIAEEGDKPCDESASKTWPISRLKWILPQLPAGRRARRVHIPRPCLPGRNSRELVVPELTKNRPAHPKTGGRNVETISGPRNEGPHHGAGARPRRNA